MISPAIAPDRFTWSRVAAIIKLMLPRLKTLILVAIVMGVISSLIIWGSSKIAYGSTIVSILILIPAITYYICPVFVRGTISPSQFGQLPATAGEKLAALLIIILGLGLVTYYLPQSLTTFLLKHGSLMMGADSKLTCDVFDYFSPLLMCLSYLGSSLPTLVCLYCITSWPLHRWRAAIIAVGVIFVQGLFGGLYGGIMAFNEGLKAGISGREMPDQEEIAWQIIMGMKTFLWFYSSAIVVLCGLFIWLSYRRLAKGQNSL